jgi:hypothetical protein
MNVFNCSNNQLNTLFLKNGINESVLDFSNNPNLEYICADEGQIASIQNSISNYNYTNCHVNSYCSFTPGGTFYTIQGINKYDEENNGCSSLDTNFANLKLNFSDGINTSALIADETGSYHYDVQAGTHTITPWLENPSYFIVSPSTSSVNFPAQASPGIQDYCISANGVHSDLEVLIIPINQALPGFDANYKIIYKNKGTNTQSGTINLTFDDTTLDYVSSSVITIPMLNNLNWSFLNLLPFETREILVTFNLNSPLETPPLNSGNILNYTATATGLIDETPIDNVSTFDQIVVNSFDPNEKECLQGSTISPTSIGKYVHYIIHFQNDGTANAQNIVVKDIIDTNKFDISSLVPLSGSHPYTTKVSETNKLEFIFQNIQLPFAIGMNQGYVAFKIKTKSSLVLGNTFSNTANIYFDYNAPIVTNTATTSIQALNVQNFEFLNYISIYPNPTKNLLNIKTKSEIEITSIGIYDVLGQVVLVVSNAESTKTIDVSDLQLGTYFIKVQSNKGISSTKFIKE